MSGVDPNGYTGHLNLKWTVGDMDRLHFMTVNRSMSFDAVALKLRGTALACSAERLREIWNAHRLPRELARSQA